MLLGVGHSVVFGFNSSWICGGVAVLLLVCGVCFGTCRCLLVLVLMLWTYRVSVAWLFVRLMIICG